MTVGVFDSGLGGLTVVKSLLSHIDGIDIRYVADTANAPYGEKSIDEIRAFSRRITQALVDRFDIDALVVACNTATAAAVSDLRETFPELIIVGTEPGIKPACASTNTGAIGVLATPATLQSTKYRNLTKNILKKHRVTVIEQACPGLVDRIERGEAYSVQTREMLAQWLEPMKQAGVDTIVLGCTHYPIVAPVIHDIMSADITLIDTGDAIAKRLRSLLEAPLNMHSSSLHLYTTGTIDQSAVERILGFSCNVQSF
jgi:glutamate racemase